MGQRPKVERIEIGRNMAESFEEIDEKTSYEERHYWCTVLIERGWDQDSAMEATGLAVSVCPETGKKECYIKNITPNRPPPGQMLA
jgi:hypothetical protein